MGFEHWAVQRSQVQVGVTGCFQGQSEGDRVSQTGQTVLEQGPAERGGWRQESFTDGVTARLAYHSLVLRYPFHSPR